MLITKQQIEAAHDRIRPYIHRTPVLTNRSINAMTGAEIFFKCENFQKIGAFKIRGAMNAALTLTAEQLKNGLATHSSGNHAQAIALAAKTLGTKAYIVMPNNSPMVKVNAVREYGAQITFSEANQEARESTLQKIIDATAATFIHPYDDYRVISGQATCTKELIEDTEFLDILLAPIGGGGLFSGCCLSGQYFSPSAAIYGAEPAGAADAMLSIQSGKVEQAPFVDTIADGLLTTLSDKTLGIIKQHVKDVLLVTEVEIKAALRLVLERMKIIIEPSSAVPLAAILKHPELFKNKRVGLILTGGNVDLTKFGDWF